MDEKLWEFSWAHIDVEHHLFVSLQSFLELVSFTLLEICLAGTIEILFHLCVIKLFADHIEVPVRLR